MTDVLELLKRSDPVDARELRTQEPPADVLERILATPRDAEHRAARKRRPRLLVPAAGLGLAAVLAVALLVGGGARPDEAAAAALSKLADVARAQPDPTAVGPGEFVYSRTDALPVLAMGAERPFHREIQSSDDFGFAIVVPQLNEMWQGRRSGLVRNVAGSARFPTAGDRAAWVAAGRPRLPGGDTFRVRDDGGIERSRLSTDPDELLKQLKDHAADGDHGNAYIFGELIADNLREPGVDPEQRAALYEVAAALPGIELLGRRTDRDGRRGTAFAAEDRDGHTRVTLIIDPDTGVLLAKRTVTLAGNPIPAGTVVEDSTFAAPAVVDAIGERP
jgi:RNA polymerase sigma-70 factor (ECF subfamily)